MYSNCKTKHKHLTIDLIKFIEKYNKEDKSNIKIDKLLDKNNQNINNKLKKVSIVKIIYNRKLKTVYISEYAQLLYDKNKKKYIKNLKVGYTIENIVIHYLKQKNSHKMISVTKINRKYQL